MRVQLLCSEGTASVCPSSSTNDWSCLFCVDDTLHYDETETP